jgi:hypothetical protein
MADEDYARAASRIQSNKDPIHFMGSDLVNLQPNADTTFTFEPEYDLNVEHIRIANAFAAEVAIVGMKVGPISMMAGGGMFPGDSFRGDGTLKLALATPVTQKNTLKVTVRNLGSGIITGFYIGVAGRVKRAA